MFCPKCGKETGDGAFCPHCGSSQTSAMTTDTGQLGLAENIAGLLCYLFGWVTGIVFLIIDKRPVVRFHALQSIFTFGAISLLYFILGLLPFSLWRLVSSLYGIISLVGLILWILLIIKAYQGQQFKLPIAGQMAEKWSSTLHQKGVI